MVTALDFLHEQNVMHRDIKPANILCENPHHIKLGDFGVSRETAYLPSHQGTVVYMAPEVQGFSHDGTPANIWSVGVVLIERTIGLPTGGPREGRRWCERILRRLTEYIHRREKEQDWENSTESRVMRFIQFCMIRMDPRSRYTASRCLEEHAWFFWAYATSDGSDSGSGTTTPTQEDPNGSLCQAPLDSPESDESAEVTSQDELLNTEGSLKTPSQTSSIHEERLTVEVFDDRGSSLFIGNAHGPSSQIPLDASEGDEPAGVTFEDVLPMGGHVVSSLNHQEVPEASIPETKPKRKREDRQLGTGSEEDESHATVRASSAQRELKRSKSVASITDYLNIQFTPVNPKPADQA